MELHTLPPLSTPLAPPRLARLAGIGSPLPWRVLIVAVSGVMLLALFAYDLRMSALVDLEAYYSGAIAVREGGDLYERALAWQRDGYTLNAPDRVAPTEGFPYVYPPALAVAFVPVTFLPYDAIRALWLAALFACLIGTAFLLARLLLPGSLRDQVAPAMFIAAAFVLFQPTRASLFAGQADCLLLLLAALSLTAFARGHDRRSALWLALAIAIKPTLAFLLLFYLWKRALRLVIFAGVGSAILVAAPLLLLGWQPVLDFIEVARFWSSEDFATSPVNQAPYGFLLRLFRPNPYTVPLLDLPALATVLRWTGVLAALALLLKLVSPSRAISRARLCLEYGLAITVMLIVAPLSEDVQYIYLLIPFVAAAYVLLFAPRPSLSTAAPFIALLGVYLYFCLPKLSEIKMAFYRTPAAMPEILLTGAHMYGLLCLLLLMVVTLRWYGRQPAGARDAARPSTLPEAPR